MKQNNLRAGVCSVAYRRRRLALLLFFTIAACGFSGCQNVAFYERERLSDSIMVFDSSPTEIHFYQKTYYSREGSAGGIGTGAGGGCGCY